MGLKILQQDNVAVIWNSSTQRALPPVFCSDGVDAEVLAKKFIEWVNEKTTDAAMLMSDARAWELSQKFLAIGWKECPWSCCGSNLIMRTEDCCEECLHECGVCFASGAQILTRVIVVDEGKNGLRRERRVRACEKCLEKRVLK